MRHKILAAVAILGVSSQTIAADFAGVFPGMGMMEASRRIGAYGELKSRPWRDEATGIEETLFWNEPYNMLVCKGVVVSIAHSLSPSFAAFTRTFQTERSVRGQPTNWTVNNSEAMPEAHSIIATWDRPGEQKYSLDYAEVGGQNIVTESTWLKCT